MRNGEPRGTQPHYRQPLVLLPFHFPEACTPWHAIHSRAVGLYMITILPEISLEDT